MAFQWPVEEYPSPNHSLDHWWFTLEHLTPVLAVDSGNKRLFKNTFFPVSHFEWPMLLCNCDIIALTSLFVCGKDIFVCPNKRLFVWVGLILNSSAISLSFFAAFVDGLWKFAAAASKSSQSSWELCDLPVGSHFDGGLAVSNERKHGLAE